MSDYMQAWSFVEETAREDDIAARARHQAREYGIPALSRATCSFLTLFAGAVQARNVVEIGTGLGLSGLALLRGNSGLTLTTIDYETEAQAIAARVFHSAGFRSGLTRLINGRSADIFPRLASSTYDMVLIDSDPLDAVEDVAEAFRLLRTGGHMIFAHALAGGDVANPARRDEAVSVVRTVVKDVLSREDVVSSLLPLGDGLLIARTQ